MKKYIIILFAIFITPAALAQWSGEINLSQFTVQSQSQMNACVDANGIHIVYWHNGGIKYARASYDGSTVYYYDRVIEPEGSNSDFVNIVSVNNSTLYVVYKKNNTINIKQSVNLGYDWSQYSSRPMTNSGCDKVVAYSDGDDIHIGWTEYKGNPEYHYDSYYIKFQTSPIQWSYYKEVTDQEWGGGKDPDLTVSANKVHYLYKDGLNDTHSRDKVKNSPNWDSPQYIPFAGSFIEYHKPVIANNEINAAFRVYYSTFYVSGAFISNSDRPFDQGFWNENVYLRESEVGYETEVESTVDNKIHFIYYDKNDYMWEHRYFDGSNLSGQIGEIPLVAYPSSTLIANSNDLYLLALWSTSTPTWIKLQHYDAAPSAPTNLTVTKSAANHPLLSWTKNNEPDMNYYKVEKYAGEDFGWVTVGQTSNLSLEDVTETYCTAVPPAKCLKGHMVSYRVKAIDIQSNSSEPSNIVNTIVDGGIPYKLGNGEGTNVTNEYALLQNYPNPFNPSTEIKYSLAEDSYVTVKVYDVLGTEVKELVANTQTAGAHTINFNASNLPSGVYIYRITASQNGKVEFTESKQMLLMK